MSCNRKRAPRRIDEFAGRADGGGQIPVAERVVLDQVHRAAQRVAQGVDQTEELFERRQVAIGVELDQEIHVARGRVEIRAALRRPKDLKAHDAVATANFRQLCFLVGNSGVHAPHSLRIAEKVTLPRLGRRLPIAPPSLTGAYASRADTGCLARMSATPLLSSSKRAHQVRPLDCSRHRLMVLPHEVTRNMSLD